VNESLRSQSIPGFTVRCEASQTDVEKIRRITAATQFFSQHEVDIAVELVEERLSKGPASGYEFIFADSEGSDGSNTLAGYVCYGEIPCTTGSYDIYWIVVSPSQQRRGLGRSLLRLTEEQIIARNGRKAYVDTSGRPQYQPTRDFYLGCGYVVEAELLDFYALGDSKVILAKTL
jgi:ribosomal protein S18 acetylase RimI-like enzyme